MLQHTMTNKQALNKRLLQRRIKPTIVSSLEETCFKHNSTIYNYFWQQNCKGWVEFLYHFLLQGTQKFSEMSHFYYFIHSVDALAVVVDRDFVNLYTTTSHVRRCGPCHLVNPQVYFGIIYL